jgi:hypothetical protein
MNELIMWLTDELQVLEVRPSIMWDKGKAVEFLLQSLGKCHAASSSSSSSIMVVFHRVTSRRHRARILPNQ